MTCADGVRLASRLWRPAGEGPWPVLLMRQPYGRAIASTVTYAHPHWYAAQGFLVVVQDVRGRGDSEGVFGGFAQEAADSAAAVRWCRRLADGNGRVGTYGFSYQGLSQLLGGATAASQPETVEADPDPLPDPLPDCLAPAMCGLDERLHWASEGGAHWWNLGVAWALQLAAQGCRRRQDQAGWRAIRRSLESGAYLDDGMELLERLDPGGMGLAWLRRDPARNEGWQCHAVSDALLRRPLLLIGGWHDPHLAGVLDLHERSRRAGGKPALVIGAWSHLDWNGGLDALQLAFFRRHLMVTGDNNTTKSNTNNDDPAALPAGTLPAGPTTAQGGSLALQVLTPPAGSGRQGSAEGASGMLWWHEAITSVTCRRGWALRSNGLAAIRSDEGELWPLPPQAALASGAGEPPPPTVPGSGSVTLVHDPWRPVPSRGGHLGLPAGPVERGDLDRRGDVACFQTAVLPDTLPLLGRPVLELAATADQPGFDLWVCLSVVRAQGEVLQLCTGVLRRLGIPALQPSRLEVQLQPVAALLVAGERLRLSLAASAWPAIAVNPGDGSLPRGGSGPQHRVISLTFDLSAARLHILPLLGAN
ncbi:MAG: CocE/NonD family hydrolase [Cyanobium sp.]